MLLALNTGIIYPIGKSFVYMSRVEGDVKFQAIKQREKILVDRSYTTDFILYATECISLSTTNYSFYYYIRKITRI